MKSLTFKKQVILELVLIVVGNLIAFIFHKGIFSNIAWIINGLLFIFNPVYPAHLDSKKGKLCVRIVGVIFIAVGFLTRFSV